MDMIYQLSKALPNKWLNSDGSVTDGEGNIISPASDIMAEVYNKSKAQVNKYIDIDGETKTKEQITTLFIPVTELPESGEKSKIYLLPTENGKFDEYFWNENNMWDKIGEVRIDLSNYPTFEQMDNAIDNAVYDVLKGEY